MSQHTFVPTRLPSHDQRNRYFAEPLRRPQNDSLALLDTAANKAAGKQRCLGQLTHIFDPHLVPFRNALSMKNRGMIYIII